MDNNNQREIQISNGINMSNIEFPQQSFNSQLLNNKDIPRESGDTVSIIEKKYFQYRGNSNDINKSESKDINDYEEEEEKENIDNPFYQPKNGEKNNNVNGLIMNENKKNENHIFNEKKSFIYNINGNLYEFLGEINSKNEDNIIISDLNNYMDFQNNINFNNFNNN